MCIMNGLRIRINKCSLSRSKHLCHYLKCENFKCVKTCIFCCNPFMVKKLLFLHAIKYSQTGIRVWFMCIERDSKVLYMIIWSCIFRQFILSYSAFINFNVTCPGFICLDTEFCSNRSTPYFSDLSWKDASI